jgi:hypothetical protein
MESDILLAALFKYEIGYYVYSSGAHTGFAFGDPEVDCSQLVWDGLVGAGYQIPGVTADTFSTHTLFNTNAQGETTFTSTAYANFGNPISALDVAKQYGTLQYGDIICWHSATPTLVNGVETYDQHVGIFYGYDSQGYPMFYGSQSSTGPAVVDMKPGTAWNNGSEIIVGALRPSDSMHTGVATGLAAPTSGTGMNIPGQTPDPTASYRRHGGSDGSVMLFYSDGSIFTYQPSVMGIAETWSIPNQDGSSTVLSRSIYNPGTPQASFGEWVTQDFNIDGIADTAPTAVLVNQIAIASGDNSVNPFLDPATAQAFALAQATGSALPSLANQEQLKGSASNYFRSNHATPSTH